MLDRVTPTPTQVSGVTISPASGDCQHTFQNLYTS